MSDFQVQSKLEEWESLIEWLLDAGVTEADLASRLDYVAECFEDDDFDDYDEESESDSDDEDE